jgi:hypothetical protein
MKPLAKNLRKSFKIMTLKDLSVDYMMEKDTKIIRRLLSELIVLTFSKPTINYINRRKDLIMIKKRYILFIKTRSK